MTEHNALICRLVKYVLPVFSFALIFNIPKFMEADIYYNVNNSKTGDPDEPFLAVTDLRLNPDYAIYYNNWARLAVLGIIPAVMLVFFNTKIYQDIRVCILYAHFYLYTLLLIFILHVRCGVSVHNLYL